MKQLVKYYSSILLLLSVIVSCEDYLPLPSDDMPDTVLLVYASLSSADTEHTVIVAASSRKDGLIEAKDVTVSIYVNGILTGKTTDGQSSGDSPDKQYTVHAVFAPGDKVEVKVDSPIGHASASSEILPAPDISDITYDGQLTMPYYDGFASNQFENTFDIIRFTIHDAPGRGNAYKIELFQEADYELISDESDDDNPIHYRYPVGWITHFPRTETLVYNMLEPAMRLDWGGNQKHVDCNFNLLSDRFFDGTAYRVSVLSEPEQYPISYGGKETWALKRMAIVRAETIPSEAYRYYSDAEFAMNGQMAVPLFYEPPVMPSNVSGGLGFVCFASAVEFELQERVVLYGYRGGE